MPIQHAILRKATQRSSKAFAAAENVANSLLSYLNESEVQARIALVHKLGASSIEVQSAILPGMQTLGFTPEKKALFQEYAVPALRPDYYLIIEDTGIMLEVERGKTTTNNMDLLDFWKCHICDHAEYLFLLVPQARPSKNGSVMRHFKQAQNRLSTFFIPKNYANVEAVFIFGY